LPTVFAQSCIQKTGLSRADFVSASFLARRTILQGFLEFRDSVGVDQRNPAVLEPCMVLAREDEALNFSGGKPFAGICAEGDAEVEPLDAGRGNLKARFDALDIAGSAVLQTLFHGNLPFAAKFWEISREESEDAILAFKAVESGGVGSAEARTHQSHESRSLRNGVPQDVAGGRFGIGKAGLGIVCCFDCCAAV
jgi:hypothetical protein